MAATVDKPMPLSHRLRICAALDGAHVNLSRADLLALAKVVEFHEDGRGMIQLASIKATALEHERRIERWAAPACAFMAASAVHGMLQDPTAALAAWILGLLQ